MSSIPESKQELQLAISTLFPKLMADYRAVPASRARECGVEGHSQGTLISVCDTVAYLIGWGKLVLKWYRLKSQGQAVDLPETGYQWNQLGTLAKSFHQEYANWSYEALLTEWEVTVGEVQTLIASLSHHELYEVAWYNQWTLGRMIQFNTSSPMKNMRTKVRRFIRILPAPIAVR